MITKVIPIGNSKGLIIPAAFLKEMGITEEVVLEKVDNTITIQAIHSPRAGWKKAFQQLPNQSEELLLPDVFIDEKLEEW